MQVKPKRNVSMDYFKAFLTILVVLHHSILSYTINAKSGIPIADKASFIGFDFFVGLFDNFFMFAFFFVSGYFVWASIQKKGASQWIAERARRLGIPFGVGILTVNLITYFLSGLIRVRLNTVGITPKAKELWTILIQGIAQHGYHLWFLWLLLFFSVILVVILKATPNPAHPLETGRFFRSPGVFLPCFLGLLIVCYTPMVAIFGTAFVGIGPFDLQISRLFIYFLFFLTGYLFGKQDRDTTLLFKESRFTKSWWVLLLAGLGSYGLIYYFYILGDTTVENAWLKYAFPFLSVIAAVFLTFGIMNAFNCYVFKSNKTADSLSKNAFYIYFIHYVVVTGLLYVLYDINLPGLIKGMIVFAASLPLSWLLAILWSRMVSFIMKSRTTSNTPELRT